MLFIKLSTLGLRMHILNYHSLFTLLHIQNKNLKQIHEKGKKNIYQSRLKNNLEKLIAKYIYYHSLRNILRVHS